VSGNRFKEDTMRIVDLRRDTITLPTHEMKEEAFGAPLGDSVYGEDPKQNELEERAALTTGKEAAIFVPSGTMGNLVALLSHTERGDEVIMEENAHIRLSETGGAACVAGLMIKTVGGRDGAPEVDGVERAIRSDNIHYPKTSLICLESTHYRYGGIVPPLETFKEIRQLSERFGIPVHLDGARVFNSAVYLGVDVKEITRYSDSVMISLSKALGAPVGSVLCGAHDFIKKARRYRKMLGGGMRQTGWLCTCGLLALSDENIMRLGEDHRNARLLAEGLAETPGFHIDLERVHTNFVSQPTALPLLGCLEKDGVYATPADDKTIRFVTSRQVSGDDMLYALEVIRKAVADL
jgi:threonine aldolase